MTLGVEVFRIHLPQGMSVNAYALKMTSPAEALGVLIREAEWVAQGKRNDASMQTLLGDNATESLPTASASDVDVSDEPVDVVMSEADTAHADELPIDTIPAQSTPMPELQNALPDAEVTDSEVVICFGNRRYRIRGLELNHSYAHLKINLLVGCDELFHVDNLDLYSHKHRISFINNATQEIGVPPKVMKKDLGKVLLKLESLQEGQIQSALSSEHEQKELTVQERQDALDYLQQPNLIECIQTDFESMGVVGEDINVVIGYLAGISRHLSKPLAIIIQSSSAAGKSSLMDAMLAMVPDEDKVQFAAMTGQSLFYMGEATLKHKILAISEEEGAEQAAYALKLLQSQGELTIASTGKDT